MKMDPGEPDGGHPEFFQPVSRQEIISEKKNPQQGSPMVGRRNRSCKVRFRVRVRVIGWA
jgi:hypothetical protein